MADRAIKKISQIENMQDLADYVGVALNLLTFFEASVVCVTRG